MLVCSLKKKIQIFLNIYKYLSKKFVNIYQEREKLTTFSLTALICDLMASGREKKLFNK